MTTANSSTHLTSPAAERLPAQDWLRIAALSLLLPYHVGMYYTGWGWHVYSEHTVSALRPWLQLLSPWRLDLLFVVAGAAAACAIARQGASAGWLRQRLGRLLLPLLFGMALLVPPQSWLEVQQKWGWGGSYGEFLALYFSGYDGFCNAAGKCLKLPTWNHLWFLPYLACCTVLWWALCRLRPGAPARAAAMLQRLLAAAAPGRPTWHAWHVWAAPAALLALPVAGLAASRVWLGPRFPTTHALLDDPLTLLQYAAMFAFGALLPATPALGSALRRLRHWALLLAVAAWGWRVGTTAGPLPLRALAYSVQQWGALVAALGFALLHLQAPQSPRLARWRQRLAAAVFPVYLVHQTVTIVLARWLAPLHWPWLPEALSLWAGTLAVSVAAYLVADRATRRGAPKRLRRWLGLPSARDAANQRRALRAMAAVGPRQPITPAG